MKTNRDLRTDIDDLADRVDRGENENFHLSTENRELRDRIEILETVIGQSNVGNEFGNIFVSVERSGLLKNSFK